MAETPGLAVLSDLISKPGTQKRDRLGGVGTGRSDPQARLTAGPGEPDEVGSAGDV